jgi:hypothetical protein
MWRVMTMTIIITLAPIHAPGLLLRTTLVNANVIICH